MGIIMLTPLATILAGMDHKVFSTAAWKAGRRAMRLCIPEEHLVPGHQTFDAFALFWFPPFLIQKSKQRQFKI